jgi:hypothetical protein
MKILTLQARRSKQFSDALKTAEHMQDSGSQVWAEKQLKFLSDQISSPPQFYDLSLAKTGWRICGSAA